MGQNENEPRDAEAIHHNSPDQPTPGTETVEHEERTQVERPAGTSDPAPVEHAEQLVHQEPSEQ